MEKTDMIQIDITDNWKIYAPSLAIIPNIIVTLQYDIIESLDEVCAKESI